MAQASWLAGTTLVPRFSHFAVYCENFVTYGEQAETPFSHRENFAGHCEDFVAVVDQPADNSKKATFFSQRKF
jgi:hypothetical protein